MFHLRLPKSVLTVCLLVLMTLIMSCGEEATPASPPPADLTSEDIAATVQRAISAAMPTSGAQEMPSEADIATLVQGAIQESGSQGASPEEIQAMVQPPGRA